VSYYDKFNQSFLVTVQSINEFNEDVLSL